MQEKAVQQLDVRAIADKLLRRTDDLDLTAYMLVFTHAVIRFFQTRWTYSSTTTNTCVI